MVWCVSGPGIHDELQNLMCWCGVRQTTNVAEDGVATSGYGTEYARQVIQEDSKQNEVDGMKKGADSTGKVMHM